MGQIVIIKNVDLKDVKLGMILHWLKSEEMHSSKEVVVTKLGFKNGKIVIHTVSKSTNEIIVDYPHKFRIAIITGHVGKVRQTHCWSCKREKLSSDIDKLHDKVKCSWTDKCIVCPKCGAAGCEKQKFNKFRTQYEPVIIRDDCTVPNENSPLGFDIIDDKLPW